LNGWVGENISVLARWIVLLPLLGAAVAGAMALAKVRRGAHWAAIAGVGGAAALSVLIAGGFAGDPDLAMRVAVGEWMPIGIGASFGFYIDGLTAVMLATVTVVSFLIVVYSRGYMREDAGYPRFFALLALFVASMCVLVLADNFLLLYLGWEAVGMCSYLLIGFWYRKPSAANAAVKAFAVNRIGDLGFAIGVLTIVLTLGAAGYGEVFGRVGEWSAGMATLVALLLFCGAVGKSAQLPLYVWLPDAMEGPTPVSALIHAATMVTAGVYMVARCGAIFAASPVALEVVAIVGGLTAIYAATIALAQYDMKRILAYSTISQLGYMFLGVGVLAPAAGVFHLVTHAFFKGLLFLTAGAVMHAMAGEIDIRRIGGLRRIMPVTYGACLVGCLALAGVPPLAGFWSKDEIIGAALHGHPVLGMLAIVTAALTAFYIFRMFFRAFHGELRVPAEAGRHAGEVERWMRWPMALLAAGSVAVGAALGWPVGHGWIERVLEGATAWSGSAGHAAEEGGVSHWFVSGGLTVLALAMVGLAWVLYRGGRGVVERWGVGSGAGRALLRGAYGLVHQKYYVDEVYQAAVVGPLRRLAWGSDATDSSVINGVLYTIAAVPRGLGYGLRLLQRGAVQGYALAGLVVLALMLLAILRLAG